MTADVLDFDWLVIGSGFGGSISALRLSEKGFRVGVLERGRRYNVASNLDSPHEGTPGETWT